MTPSVSAIVSNSKIINGTVTVFFPGSTVRYTIEYESGVLEDLKKAIERIAPSNVPYAHDPRWETETASPMSGPPPRPPSRAHPSSSLALGTWQQIVFIDFDNRGGEEISLFR